MSMKSCEIDRFVYVLPRKIDITWIQRAQFIDRRRENIQNYLYEAIAYFSE